MKRRYLSLAITLVTGCAIGAVLLMGPLGAPAARADGTYFSLAGGNFTQDWTNGGQFTTDNNWDGVPSIIGYDGADPGGVAGTDPCSLATNPLGSAAVSVGRQHPSTITDVAVAQFIPGPGSQVTNAVVGIRGQTSFDAPALLIHLNATGRQNINLTFDAVDIDESGSNAMSTVAVQWRAGSSGAFSNIHCVTDATEGPTLKGLVTPVNVALPAGANNQAQLQIRIMTYNAAGSPPLTSSDEWIGIDNIVVSSTGAAGPTPTNTGVPPTPTNTSVPPTQDPSLNNKLYLPVFTH
jgi:hypothetical protein